MKEFQIEFRIKARSILEAERLVATKALTSDEALRILQIGHMVCLAGDDTRVRTYRITGYTHTVIPPRRIVYVEEQKEELTGLVFGLPVVGTSANKEEDDFVLNFESEMKKMMEEP